MLLLFWKFLSKMNIDCKAIKFNKAVDFLNYFNFRNIGIEYVTWNFKYCNMHFNDKQ